MIVHIEKAKTLKTSECGVLPQVGRNVVKRFLAGNAEILFEKDVPSQGTSDLVALPYTMLVLYQGQLKFVASIERIDLRSLSYNLGTSLRELQEEYGTKGFFAESHTFLYGNGDREELEEYTGDLADDAVKAYLLEVVLDGIDSVADVVECD